MYQGYDSNPFFETILSALADDQPLQHKEHFSLVDSLLFLDSEQLCVPAVANLHTWVLMQSHDAPIGGHLGVECTCEKVARHFYWPGL